MFSRVAKQQRLLAFGKIDHNTYQERNRIGENGSSGSTFHRNQDITSKRCWTDQLGTQDKGWSERESAKANEAPVLTSTRRVKYAARFKARLVALGRKQMHGSDCAIVAVKDETGHSRNGALAQGELSIQHYFGKEYTTSSE